MTHDEVVDVLDLAAAVIEDADISEDNLNEDTDDRIEEIETAIYKLSFLVHSNNYCSILVKFPLI